MRLDAIRTRIRDAGLGGFEDHLVELVEPALVLEPLGEGAPVGRLGGLPRLPAGTPWPQSRWPTAEPEPLAFLAEFDLARLDRAIWPGPPTGTLSFFCAIDPEAFFVDSGGAALVMHHPPGVALSPLEPPAHMDEQLRFREVLVTARAAATMPTGGTVRGLGQFGDADPDSERATAYWHMCAGLLGIPTHLVPHHQLLGWLRWAVDDPLSPWPELHAGAVEYGLSTADPPIERWRPLLHIASDHERIGTEFGDGGTLTFAIGAADLAAGRFERVQAVNDSA